MDGPISPFSLKVITTSDGSHSLLREDLQETYHSVHGALQESMHVFIGNGLDHALSQKPASPLRVLEIGMGTGLNALLTHRRALAVQRQVYYTTLEPYPLSADILHQLNYAAPGEELDFFLALHAAPWEVEVKASPYFTFTKSRNTWEAYPVKDRDFDLVYYDAFAPNKQPGLWEKPVFEKLYNALDVGGILVTYCAKGQVKRDLRDVGFALTALPGPPGKKEMTRAIKQ